MKPIVGDYIVVTGGIADFIGSDIRPAGQELIGSVGVVVTHKQRLMEFIYPRYKSCYECFWYPNRYCKRHGDGAKVDYIAIELLDGKEKGKKLSADSLDYRILGPLEILAVQAL